MTVKEFFKSKSLKCILALLCVLLVCGIFLTIMNGLLAVSSEERFERAIMKIYGKSVPATEIKVANYDSNANIEEAYKMGDGNYLVKSTGKGGFSSGTVTCWVVIEITGNKISGIGKVVVDSNTQQTQMAEISASYLDSFSKGYTDGIYYSTADGYYVASSTLSSNAVCNSVNGALAFVKAIFGDVAEDIYSGFDYIENIQTTRSSHVYNEDDGSVTFTVVSKGYGMAGSDFTSLVTVDKNGRLADFEVVVSGSTADSYTDKALQNVNNSFIGKNLTELLALFKFGVDDTINYPGNGKFPVSGASNSSFSLYNAALFAVANYDKCVPEGAEPDVDEDVTEDAEQPEGGEENEQV